MKARIKNTEYEVEVVPYFPEGMFAGFTDVSGTLLPGMVVYKPSDLDFIETPPKLKPSVDWDSFRREAAKDILAAIMSQIGPYFPHSSNSIYVHQAIEMADELIKQLKEGKK